jgi:two-component system response regulator MprA
MKQLLFIDDDVDVRDAFADLLIFSGWEVVAAADGLEALAWLVEHAAPAVILLDLKMPRCDGYEFRSRQLEDPRLRAIPTVVFTADAQPEPSLLRGLGDVVLVRKSDEFSDLLQQIERVTR